MASSIQQQWWLCIISSCNKHQDINLNNFGQTMSISNPKWVELSNCHVPPGGFLAQVCKRYPYPERPVQPTQVSTNDQWFQPCQPFQSQLAIWSRISTIWYNGHGHGSITIHHYKIEKVREFVRSVALTMNTDGWAAHLTNSAASCVSDHFASNVFVQVGGLRKQVVHHN